MDDGLMTDPARMELASRLIASLKAKPDVARRVSQIDVHDVHNAEVILAGGDAGRAGEAAGLLEAIRPRVEEQRLLRNVVFRFLLAPARAAHATSSSGRSWMARNKTSWVFMPLRPSRPARARNST